MVEAGSWAKMAAMDATISIMAAAGMLACAVVILMLP
jgi:hypothetical protein